MSVVLVCAMWRRDVRELLLSVVKAFFRIKILGSFFLFTGYTAMWVVLGQRIGIWSGLLIKETVLWYLVAGFPMLLQLDEAMRNGHYFRRILLGLFGASLILNFFIGLYIFELVVEIVLFPVSTFIALLAAFTGANARYASQKRFWAFLLFLIATWLLLVTARNINEQRDSLEVVELAQSLLLEIWLPIVSLPFVYLWFPTVNYETVFMRMCFFNGKRPTSLRIKITVLLGLNVRVREVHSLNGVRAKRIATAPTFSEARRAVEGFRRDQVRRRIDEQARRQQLTVFAGVGGDGNEEKSPDPKDSKRASLFLSG